jgi:hypothetical protein
MRVGEELKAPRHASAAAIRDGNLPYSRQILYRLKLYKSLSLLYKEPEPKSNTNSVLNTKPKPK